MFLLEKIISFKIEELDKGEIKWEKLMLNSPELACHFSLKFI
jgi:hypothetical protein